MNQKERNILCIFIAEMKYNTDPTGPAAYAYSVAGSRIQSDMKISDEEMEIYLKMALYDQTKMATDNEDYEDETFDEFSDLWHEIGEAGIVDLFDHGTIVERTLARL